MKNVTEISKRDQSESVDIEWTLSKASTQKRQISNDRKLNVVLINPEDIDAHKRFSELNPFAGLAYLASYLDHQFGHAVDIEIIEMLPQQLKISDVIKLIARKRADIVGITSKTYNYPIAEKIAHAVKETSPQTMVVMGGAHATAIPEQVISNKSIDIVIPFEGELVLAEIVYRLLSGLDPYENLSGAWYKKEGEIVKAGPAQIIENLDDLPFPNWDKYYNLNLYDKQYDNKTGKFYSMLPIFASRSCPYKCHFCQPVLTRKHRVRSPDNVLDEVEEMIQRYGIQRLYFEDAIFGVKKDWFMELCDGWINRDLVGKVDWGFETNVNCCDLERMQMAKAAGCVYVYFGMESASDKVLHHLGKGATKEKLRDAVDIAKKAGIREVSGSFIFGLPYETKETAKETLNFISESPLDSININLLDVYPGTDLYKMVENNIGGIKWIPGMKNKWDACGRTMAKTTVNDLDSTEKLEAIMVEARTILHEKYRENYYEYFRKIVKYFLFYIVHNRVRLFDIIKRSLTAYGIRIGLK